MNHTGYSPRAGNPAGAFGYLAPNPPHAYQAAPMTLHWPRPAHPPMAVQAPRPTHPPMAVQALRPAQTPMAGAPTPSWAPAPTGYPSPVPAGTLKYVPPAKKRSRKQRMPAQTVPGLPTGMTYVPPASNQAPKQGTAGRPRRHTELLRAKVSLGIAALAAGIVGGAYLTNLVPTDGGTSAHPVVDVRPASTSSAGAR